VPRISVTHRTGSEYHVAVDSPDATPEALIEASFAFLLEREPKEAILARFELPVIERYFPEYLTMIESFVDAGD
jgi:hypothetical protein